MADSILLCCSICQDLNHARLVLHHRRTLFGRLTPKPKKLFSTHMEESPIIDSPTEGKPPFLALGLSIVAIVLGGVAFVLSFKTSGSVKKFEEQNVGVDNVSLVKKLDEANQQIVVLRQELSTRNEEVSVLKGKVDTLGSDRASFTSQVQRIVGELGVRIATLERRPGSGAVPSRAVVGDPPRGPVTPPVGPVTPGGLYSVVEGDNFTRIAKKNGVTLSALEVANPGVDSSHLRVGQKIKIPVREAVSPPPVRRPAQPATPPRSDAPTPPRTGAATPLPPPPNSPR
jgi:LysM repeat protein